jgi:ferredoxin
MWKEIRGEMCVGAGFCLERIPDAFLDSCVHRTSMITEHINARQQHRESETEAEQYP